MTTDAATANPRIGISSCLLGEAVRFDGGHKRDAFVNQVLREYFEFVPCCPEVDIGLGVPRQPIRLERRAGSLRVVGVRRPQLDVSAALDERGRRMVRDNPDISGYILKSRSPSCGMQRVKVYGAGAPEADGVGGFAAALLREWPDLPVEEEGRLNDPVLRENFIERVFTYRRWQDLTVRGLSAATLVEFHTRHKLMLMSHSQQAYRELGRLVADAGSADSESLAGHYIGLLMAALRRRATRGNHANVLKHVQGYLKKCVDALDRQELNDVIERYRRGQVPLVVPITLLNHHLRRHPDAYLRRQYYLYPQPPEMVLRNLI